MKKELKDKAIDIKGRKYVLVSDRVLHFNEIYKEGCITTQLVSPPESEHIIIKAVIYPEGLNGRYFTGYSQATIGDGYINKTSALENAETSAVGRALGMMGIGVLESIASADEMAKATGSQGQKKSGTFCSACDAEGIISPKTGNAYCPNFLKHKKTGEKYSLKSKEEVKKMEEIQKRSQKDYEEGKEPF